MRRSKEKFSVFVRKRLFLSVGLFPLSLPIVHNLPSAKLRYLSAWCSVGVSHSECLGFQTTLRGLTHSMFHRTAESKLHVVHYVLASSLGSVKITSFNLIRKCFSNIDCDQINYRFVFSMSL